MSFARLLSVVVREPLPFRQLYLTRVIVAHGFATEAKVNKRPPTAYQLYASEHRANFVAQNPDKKPREINRALSDKWKEMSEEEKNPYKKAREFKMEIYNAPLKKLPKKPPTAFGLFLKENFSKVEAELGPGVGAPAVVSELSKEWKSLSDEEKEEMKQKYERMMEEYREQVSNFGKGLTSEEIAFLKEKRGPQMQKIAKEKRQILGYPKRPLSPYILFVQKHSEELDFGTPVERIKILGQKWSEMSAEEKEVYIELSRQAREKYHNDVAEWKEKHPKAA
ncbi:transcription factor A, mitochondrial-like [Oculina patagonica]